jgi:hypothetical protein
MAKLNFTKRWVRAAAGMGDQDGPVGPAISHMEAWEPGGYVSGGQ